MANNDNPTTKFRVDISELKSGIQEANRLIKLANSEFKAASSGMDDWSKSTDGLNAKIKQLTTVQAQEEAKLKNLKEQYAQVVAEQGENSKGAQDLAVKINNQQAAVNKVTSELGSYKKSLTNMEAEAGKSKTALQTLNGEINKQESDLSNLKTEYTNAVLKFGEASTEAQDLAAQITDLSGKLQENKSKLDSAASAANKLAGGVEDADDAADEAGDGYTTLKGTIANLASQAISAAIDAFKDLATEGEVSLDKLQAATGATNKEMVKYKDELTDLYNNNYGESMADLGEKFAYIKQVTGETDPSKIKELTKNAITLEDTFGSDFNETVRGTQNLMKHFGIDSQTAFDLFAKGSQNGLDYTDELGDNIAEYGGNFEQAGYSADEYFQLLENGTKGGAYNLDKVNDSINEVKNRLGDGTIGKNIDQFSSGTQTAFKNWQNGKGTMKEVINSIVGDISGATNEQEALTMAATAFGTMGEDANLDVVKSLTTVGDSYKDVNGTMKEMDEVRYDNLSGALGSLGRTIKSEFIQPIADTLAPLITDLVNFVLDHKGTIIPIIMGVATALGVLAAALGIQSLINGVQKAFLLLNGTMALNPIILVVAAIAGLVAAFVALWNKSESFRNFWIGLWESIKSVAKTTWDAISGFFSGAWEAIKGIWNAAKGFFSGVWNGIKAIFSVVRTVLGGFFSAAWNAIKAYWSVAGAYFKMIWDVIKGIFSVVKNILSGNFKGAWEAIKGIWNAAKGFFSGVWDKIKAPFVSVAGWFKDKFKAAYDGVTGIFKGLYGFFKGVWDKITGLFKKVGTTVGDAISGAVKGAINSVLSGAVKIINGFISAINFAIDIINAIPGVKIGKLDKLNTPQLAKGGVVDRATLATIGEDGKEAVIPLEKNTGWMKGLAASLVNELNKGGGSVGSSSSAVTNNYTFTQTNNSPKALSRLDIYRQTKNQFRLLKEV